MSFARYIILLTIAISCVVETAMHLLFLCSYAERVWRKLDTKLGYKLRTVSDTMQSTWQNSLRQIRGRPLEWGVQGPVLLLCTIWHIWWQRNEKLFRGKMIAPERLADRIIHEVEKILLNNVWILDV